MNLDLPLKLAVVLLIVGGSVYFWYSKEGGDISGDVEENLLGLIPLNVSQYLGYAGLNDEGYCPLINPYTSELFSVGFLDVGPGHPLHSAGCYILTNNLGNTCSERISFNFDYEKETYIVESLQYRWEGAPDALAEKFNTYSELTGTSLSLKQKIKGWQCYAFFGVLPFIAMVLFLRDIMGFAMFSPRLKNLIALFVSMIAVFTGLFSKFVWQLSQIAAISVQGTFLIVMLLLGIVSIIMSWIGSMGAAVGEARRESAELAEGLAQKSAMNAIFRAVGGGQKKD